MKERIKKLLAILNEAIYEKENEIALSLLAAVAGESIILLGPPGVAKSMVARRLKEAFKDGRSFEYLMSRFSTPDEIFGPVSISKLKTSDDYERVTEGYLPTADVVFLDEIWKAGPAIQNTLLTVINEKQFRNGNKVVQIPLKLLIAASNELPSQGEGLEALWDRFILRLESRSIKKEDNFDKMLLGNNEEKVCIPKKLQIGNDEHCKWSKAIDGISIAKEVLNAIHQIRKSLKSITVDDTDERHQVYVSDRRWKKIVRILRASAFLQDREAVGMEDLLPVYHCLWQEPEERDEIRRLVIRSLFVPYADRLENLKRILAEDIKIARAARAANRLSSRKVERDADKELYDQFYYKLEGYDDGECYIFARDYQSLPQHGNTGEDCEDVPGILYKDKKRKNVSIIRSYEATMGAPMGSSPVMLNRDDNHVYIFGDKYAIKKATSSVLPLDAEACDSGRDYETEFDLLDDDLRVLQQNIKENIFIAHDDILCFEENMRELYRSVAFARQDIQKLYD